MPSFPSSARRFVAPTFLASLPSIGSAGRFRLRRRTRARPRFGAARPGRHRHDPRQRQGRSGRRSSGRHGHRHQPRHAGFATRDDRRRRPVHAAAAAGRQLQGRRHADAASRTSRRRASCSKSAATRASTRRSSPATSPKSSRSSPTRRSSKPTTAVAVTNRGPERSAEPAARQSRSVLAAQHHRRRHQQRQLELARRAGTADDDQRVAARRRSAPVNFQLDGGNNTAGLRGTGNPAPNPEAVQEFRVITNSYAAEYGRYPAGVVDVVTNRARTVPRRRLRVLPQREAERQALGAAGCDGGEGPARSQPVSAAAFGGPLRRTRRSSSPAIRACGRKRPTIGTPRSCRPRSSGRATSRSRRDQAAAIR